MTDDVVWSIKWLGFRLYLQKALWNKIGVDITIYGNTLGRVCGTSYINPWMSFFHFYFYSVLLSFGWDQAQYNAWKRTGSYK